MLFKAPTWGYYVCKALEQGAFLAFTTFMGFICNVRASALHLEMEHSHGWLNWS
jgi:hypothetical protein